MFKKCLVIGAGAFGTSIASVLANNFKEVLIKVRSQDVYYELKDFHQNSVYLPNVVLPESITPFLTWDQLGAIDDIELVIFGLPSSKIEEYLSDVQNFKIINSIINRAKIPVISLAKGIDANTLEMPDDIFRKFFAHQMDQFLFLSGPSFAREIVIKQITAVTIAGRDTELLELASSKMLNTEYFRALPTYDIKGVLLGGALKNVLAIAGGILEGLGFNDNTRAAMITRGIAEMLRFGKVFNARPETFYGLSGMGDLILTTTGEMSRNKRFGLELAKGKKTEEILKESRGVVEGVLTAKAVHHLSEKYMIRARIFNAVYAVIYEDVEPSQAISHFMEEPAKFEIE